jgi:glycerol kinase
VKGSILGLSLSTHRRHVARAVLEGIALRMLDIVRGMERDTRIAIKSIRTDGGVSRSDILMQCLADFANLPVYRAPEADMTAIGAAYLAGLAIGFWEDFTELKSLAKGYDTFTPKMPDEKRNQKFDLWHRAVRAILSVYPEA